MKFLVDTNVFLPLEPSSIDDLEGTSASAAELLRLINEGSHQVYVHESIISDLDRDRSDRRRELRKVLASKYPTIRGGLTRKVEAVFGEPPVGSNEWVDLALLSAIQRDAADVLVTEDRKLRSRATRLELSPRVCTLEEGIGMLRSLFETTPDPPPSVESLDAYELDDSDPIFDSFRDDYPEFDGWLSKCKRQHRRTWAIRDPDGYYSAICIVDPQEIPVGPHPGERGLKICSFKVSEKYRGHKFGELMLKTVFWYAFTNGFEALLVSVFEKQEELLSLLEDFGFQFEEVRSSAGELQLTKPLAYNSASHEGIDPLEFNIRFGPTVARTAGVETFVVPIQPCYFRSLFPELAEQLPLLDAAPHGNSIRKAYLCRASTRNVPEGSNLIFYRSTDSQAARVLGVCEGFLRSRRPDEVARFVGKRTVYRYPEIVGMCSEGEVLAILFRQVTFAERGVPLNELVSRGVLNGAPQSLTSVKKAEPASWIATQLLNER